MKLGRKSLSAFAIALLLLAGALLVAKRERVHISATASPGASSFKHASATKSTPKPGVTAQPAPANPTSMSAASHAVSQHQEPSAECLAARATEAAEKAALAAMTPAQVEAAIEAVAREGAEREQNLIRAAEACLGLDSEHHEQCYAAHGVPPFVVSVENEANSRQLEAELRAWAFGLASRGDARSLVAAAISAPFQNEDGETPILGHRAQPRRIPQAIDWIVRAQAQGTDDAAVQWAVANFSTWEREPGPPALLAAKARARARLAALEPDNAAAFLVSVHQEGGAGYSRADLARAAALPHYRPLEAARVNLVLDATQDMQASPTLRRVLRQQAKGNHQDQPASVACASDAELLREFRLTMAVVLTTVAMAPISMMTCQPKDLGDSTQARDDCLHLAEQSYASGNLSDRAIAAAIAHRIAPAGPARERWQQRHRRDRWRQLQRREAYLAISPYEQVGIFERAWRRGDETLAADELIVRAGLPLEPPLGWQPPPDP